MKKRIYLAALLALAVLLSACGAEKAETGNPAESGTEVTVWAWDPNFNIRALELAEAAYEGETAIDLQIIENAQSDIVQRLNTGLSSGTTKGLPNIVLIEDYRAQSFLQSYPDAFYPLTDVIEAGDFADYKIEATSYNGEVYGLPFDTGVTGLYVRTDYLEAAGYSVSDLEDATWQDYIEIGKKIKETTGKHMLSLNPNDFNFVRMMVQSAGKWYFEADGKTPDLANNEALKEIFRVYKAMLDADIIKLNSDWSQYVGAFNSGDVATVPTGNWITPSVKAEASQSGLWHVAPLPRLAVEGGTNVSNLGGSSWYVLNQDGKEAAAAFLAGTFGSNVGFYNTLLEEVGAIGTYKPGTVGEVFEKGDDFFGGQAITKQFTSWMVDIPAVNYGIHTYAIDDILKVEMQNYLKGQDLDAVMANAQAQAEMQLQ